jgi:hypothetical protein
VLPAGGSLGQGFAPVVKILRSTACLPRNFSWQADNLLSFVQPALPSHVRLLRSMQETVSARSTPVQLV